MEVLRKWRVVSVGEAEAWRRRVPFGQQDQLLQDLGLGLRAFLAPRRQQLKYSGRSASCRAGAL